MVSPSSRPRASVSSTASAFQEVVPGEQQSTRGTDESSVLPRVLAKEPRQAVEEVAVGMEMPVGPDSRVLVRGAAYWPEVNGLYCVRHANHKSAKASLAFVQVGHADIVIMWTMKAQAGGGQDDAQRRGAQCLIVRISTGGTRKQDAVSTQMQRLYGAGATDLRKLPLNGWRNEALSGPELRSMEPTLEIVEVGDFSKLLKQSSPLSAVMWEVHSAMHAESCCHFSQAAPKSDEHKVYNVEDEDDGEVFKKDNPVVLHEDPAFVQQMFKRAGMTYDPRISPLLGQHFIVEEVRKDERIVIKLDSEDGEPILLEVPAILLDLDYSNIWAFYNSRPIFIVAQTVLCVLMWLIFASRDASESGRPWAKTLGGLESLWPGRTSLWLSSDCEDYRREVWRWFTYQLSHVGLTHILTNALMNIILGVPLEKFHGTVRMALMYQTGVFGGAMCYLVADGHRPVVGTSGGCFCLIGIRLGDLLMNWAERPYRWVRLFFLSVLVTANIAAEALSEPEGGATTSNAAHVGGGVAGLVASIVIGRNLKRTSFETVLLAAAAVFAILATGFCLFRGLQWPPQNIFEEEPWCWMRQVSNSSLFGTWDWMCIRCYSPECIQEWSLQRRLYAVIAETCVGRGGYAYTEPG